MSHELCFSSASHQLKKAHFPHEWMTVTATQLGRMRHVTYKRVMSHTNESCHILMFHCAYECVISRTDESCHTWTSHIPYERVMSHTNESWHIQMSHVTCESFISHTNASYHVKKKPYPICTSHVTCLCEMSYIWMSMTVSRVFKGHVSHMNQSSHTRMSHVKYTWVLTHMNESCDARTSIPMSRESNTRVLNREDEWDIRRDSHVWRLDQTCHKQMSHVSDK